MLPNIDPTPVRSLSELFTDEDSSVGAFTATTALDDYMKDHASNDKRATRMKELEQLPGSFRSLFSDDASIDSYQHGLLGSLNGKGPSSPNKTPACVALPKNWPSIQSEMEKLSQMRQRRNKSLGFNFMYHGYTSSPVKGSSSSMSVGGHQNNRLSPKKTTSSKMSQAQSNGNIQSILGDALRASKEAETGSLADIRFSPVKERRRHDIEFSPMKSSKWDIEFSPSTPKRKASGSGSGGLLGAVGFTLQSNVSPTSPEKNISGPSRPRRTSSRSERHHYDTPIDEEEELVLDANHHHRDGKSRGADHSSSRKSRSKSCTPTASSGSSRGAYNNAPAQRPTRVPSGSAGQKSRSKSCTPAPTATHRRSTRANIGRPDFHSSYDVDKRSYDDKNRAGPLDEDDSDSENDSVCPCIEETMQSASERQQIHAPRRPVRRNSLESTDSSTAPPVPTITVEVPPVVVTAPTLDDEEEEPPALRLKHPVPPLRVVQVQEPIQRLQRMDDDDEEPFDEAEPPSLKMRGQRRMQL